MSAIYPIFLFFIIIVLSPLSIKSQADFVIDKSHEVLFGEKIDGIGARLVWLPNSSALRAGKITATDSTAWDFVNIGRSSAAFGEDNIAGGSNSMSWGQSNQATSTWSTAFGRSCVASGVSSVAWGIQDTASAPYSTSWGSDCHASDVNTTAWGRGNKAKASEATAWGVGNNSSGLVTTAWGFNNKSTGALATVWGNDNVAEGEESTVWGWHNAGSGNQSTVWGFQNKARTQYETVLGRYADTIAGIVNPNVWRETDHLFVVGIGSTNANRRNALTVYKNGKCIFYPQDASQKIIIDTIENGSFKEPIIRPSLPDWGFIGSENHYFTKIYSNNFYAATLANYQVFSDRRLKTNIHSLQNGLDVINALNPVTYSLKNQNYKSHDSKNKERQFGLIAQEVEKILPNIVHAHASGMKSVGYQAIIPFLISGMQEQQDVINTLKLENDKLSNENKVFKEILKTMMNNQTDLLKRIANMEAVLEVKE